MTAMAMAASWSVSAGHVPVRECSELMHCKKRHTLQRGASLHAWKRSHTACIGYGSSSNNAKGLVFEKRVSAGACVTFFPNKRAAGVAGLTDVCGRWPLQKKLAPFKAPHLCCSFAHKSSLIVYGEKVNASVSPNVAAQVAQAPTSPSASSCIPAAVGAFLLSMSLAVFPYPVEAAELLDQAQTSSTSQALQRDVQEYSQTSSYPSICRTPEQSLLSLDAPLLASASDAPVSVEKEFPITVVSAIPTITDGTRGRQAAQHTPERDRNQFPDCHSLSPLLNVQPTIGTCNLAPSNYPAPVADSEPVLSDKLFQNIGGYSTREALQAQKNLKENIFSSISTSFPVECQTDTELQSVADIAMELEGEPEQTEITNESVVLEAWQVVDEAFLDARHKVWTHEAWEKKKEEALRRPIRSRMAAYATISQMLGSLDDPYSRFLTPAQFAQLAKYDVTGIGLNIGDVGGEGGQPPRLQVLGIVLGSPAQLAGVRQGDEVLAVNGTSVAGKSAFEVSSLIQGPKDMPVTIQFRHSQCSPVEEVMVERVVDVKTPVYYRLDRNGSGETEKAVGYLRLREFNARAKRDLVTAMQRLQEAGATSFILDLQDNPGGLVQAGVEIARLFLQQGATVIYTEGRDPTLARSVMATGREATTAPLAVLVNSRTASASEIVAAALHDNCRAVLIGGRTFGKGLIQSVYELSDGSGIILTVGKYVTPAHSDIDKNGIEPDFSSWPGDTKVREKLGQCQPPQAVGLIM